MPGPLLLACALLVADFFTRIIRWWCMLRVFEPGLPLRNCVRPFLISLAVNNTVPFRAGDILRTVGFCDELRSPPMRVLGTLVVERLLDLLVLLAFFFTGLIGVVANKFPPTVMKASIALTIVCLAGLLTLLLLPNQVQQGLKWVVHQRWVTKRNWSVQAEAWLEQLFGALSLLRSPKLSLQLLALSLITWVFEGGVFAAVAGSLQTDTAPLGPWFSLALSTLATLIPSLPGYVGTFDYFAMLGLVSYGTAWKVAAIFALLVHLFLWAPVTLVGALFFVTSRPRKQVPSDNESVLPTAPLQPKGEERGFDLSSRSVEPHGRDLSQTEGSSAVRLSSPKSEGRWGDGKLTNTPYSQHPDTPTVSIKDFQERPHVVVVGGGFTGLAAAYELTRCGMRVSVLEQSTEVGGLAGSFEVNGERLEKFYHHWFTNDEHVMQLVKELKAEDNVVYRTTRTGMYYAKNFFRLSSPLDLLRFKPLSLVSRIRLGLLVLRARTVKRWQVLESLTAEEWLLKICGRQAYQVVWEPLLRGKFGPFATEISAVWFWNKVKLRGSSRSKDGAEMLAYYRGGFAALAEQVATEVESKGGRIKTGTAVKALVVENGQVIGVKTSSGDIQADAVIVTTALPIIADLVEPHTSSAYVRQLRRVKYLANICLVLELDRSLSDTYWLNVNDPSFPFVGVIEHTNFEPATTYAGRHIVYLSKYLPETDELYQMTSKQALDYCIPHLQRMFPKFERNWIQQYHVWRARYSQPIVVRHYSKLIPSKETPLTDLYIATMAQIYPEDRGTNYAIREGRQVGRMVANALEHKMVRRSTK
jgi:uncharacterized protein (TIRG00374 family)